MFLYYITNSLYRLFNSSYNYAIGLDENSEQPEVPVKPLFTQQIFWSHPPK